jgi:hypothetical protein
MKILGNMSVDLNVIGQLLIRYSSSLRYGEKWDSTSGIYILQRNLSFS